MSETREFRTRLIRRLRAIRTACGVVVGLTVLILAASAGAQNGLGVISMDYYRTDRVSGESRHEILPMALFDGTGFQPVWEYSRTLRTASSRRASLLDRYPSVQVLYRGRRIGLLDVSAVYRQNFHCSALIVGSGNFTADRPQPFSEIADAVRGFSDGETIDYETQAFIATSGAIETVAPYGEPLVTEITDPGALERLARDVETVAPRQDLASLGTDETRAFRLDRYGAVLVVRKRRSAEMLPFPAGDIELESPLMTDVVLVRSGSDDRTVYPLSISGEGRDAWGKGPEDFFIDALALANGAAYLAFERRNYEAFSFRLFSLPQEGEPALAFEGELYGC